MNTTNIQALEIRNTMTKNFSTQPLAPVTECSSETGGTGNLRSFPKQDIYQVVPFHPE